MRKPTPSEFFITALRSAAETNVPPFIADKSGALLLQMLRQKLKSIPIIKIEIALTYLPHPRP